MMIDDIQRLLEDNGYDNVYCRNTPPIVGTVITLIETSGSSNKDNLRIDSPRLDVYVRSLSETETSDVLESIQALILSSMPYEVDGRHYYKARPYDIGKWSGKTNYGYYYIKSQSYVVDVAI